jgi:hypothetical protein
MKVTFINTKNEKKTIEVKSIREVKNLICSDFYKSPMEIINLHNNEYLVIDEEGKLKQLEFNEIATEMAHDNQAIFPSDFIVGNVILINDIDEFDMLPYN